MTKVLVYIEAQGGQVTGTSLELIAAAQSLGGTVEALVLDADPASLTGQVKGADTILTMADAALSPYLPEAHARALAHVVAERSPDVVLVAYSSTGLDLGPVVAVKANRPLISYCTKLSIEEGAVVAQSQAYGGKLTAASKAPLPAVVAITPGSYREEDVADRAGTSETIAAPAGLGDLRTRFKSAQAPDPDAIDITQCDKLLCVGRGIGDADSIDIAREVAAKMGAEIAGSRPVIDAGWLPKERQVGKSGNKVTPRLYLAVGVSGAPEHLEGMGSAELIIAVNSDAKAPIFDHAHFGTTVDLFDLLPALSERLGGG
jgi:electron transfer flavoprotein alpha subunit